MLAFLGAQSHKGNSAAFAALKADGSVFAWGSPESGGDCSKVQAQLALGVRCIHATQRAFAALKADGSVDNGDATPMTAQMTVMTRARRLGV